MFKKNIFIKRKKYFNKYFFFIIFISVLLVIFIQFFNNSKYNYFEVKNFNDSFYIIPEDPGGKKIMNLDKISLHLKDENNKKIRTNKDPILEYSIQILASDNLNLLNNKLDFMTKKNYNNNDIQENLLNKNDFYIVVFNHEIKSEYLLLYKNFTSRDLAFDYCHKNLKFLYKCLVVNVQKLD